MIHYLIWTQILLITLNLDGWYNHWGLTFIGMFYLLVFCMSISLGFVIILVLLIFNGLWTRQYERDMWGFAFDSINALYSWVWGFTLLGGIKYLENEAGPDLLI